MLTLQFVGSCLPHYEAAQDHGLGSQEHIRTLPHPFYIIEVTRSVGVPCHCVRPSTTYQFVGVDESYPEGFAVALNCTPFSRLVAYMMAGFNVFASIAMLRGPWAPNMAQSLVGMN